MECTFYELDQKTKDEAEKMDALWGAEFFDAEDAEPQTDAPAEENNPLLSCGAFCRYFRSGKGYPGEYVYYSCAALEIEPYFLSKANRLIVTAT